MLYYTRFNSPLCEIILAGNEEGICYLHLNTGTGRRNFQISEGWIHDHDFFKDIIIQIEEYFRGERTKFNVKLNPQGTDFQKKVWLALYAIPYGELRTYRDIAVATGNHRACRAVGMANSKNPIPLIIPCHRVIGSNGKLTGFAHGLTIKEKLIKLEQGKPDKRAGNSSVTPDLEQQ